MITSTRSRGTRSRPARLAIGTSGFHYPHWRGVFYPPALATRHWLAFYAQRLAAVELNSTFYRLPEDDVFDRWRAQVPGSFLFALKFSRYGSHLKRLREPERTIAPFVERAARLGSRLGPVLVQLPPRWRADARRLDDFLAAAPPGLRWAVEFRDPSWLCEEVYAVLTERRAALCVHDMLPGHPRRLTTDWAYLRFHGDHYQGSYGAAQLRAAAAEIRAWHQQGRDVYAFFNNDQQGYAVANALELCRLLGATPPRTDADQPT
jgi:uncharacterized protein YecE (DUF72 family)